MFEAELERRLKGIFGVKSVRFDAPNPAAKEQDTLFVDIQSCRSNITAGRECARVQGGLMLFSQNGRLPFGFFNKKIHQSDSKLTRDLFFYDFDTSTETYQNLVERRVNFIFLYSGQYDPEQGEITSLGITEVGALGVGNGDILGTGNKLDGIET
jgi:hypothetical protein